MAIDISILFKMAVKRGASDLIITVGSPPIFRINGELSFMNAESLTPQMTQDAVYSVLRADQVARFESEKELDFSFYLANVHRFRGNVFFQRSCVGAAFRLIPNKIPSLQELALPKLLEDLSMRQQGLVLITGPTGHGKSTTQAAMINIINTRKKKHIVTVEDPIEYLHRNKNCVVEQREVGEDTKSFSAALRHVLRQDPDVILIGEMRDLDTISAALTAAETGHLVISTLHTNDTVQSIDRLLDVFPPYQQNQIKSQLAFTLLAVIAQRLVPTIDGKGRIVAVEIMVKNDAVANLIREGKTHHMYSVMETHAKEGMKTMDTALKELYLDGVISYDEAAQRMRNPKSLGRI